MEKKLKTFKLSEDYTIELCVKAPNETVAIEMFNKFLSDLELTACNDADVSFYVHDETLETEESETD